MSSSRGALLPRLALIAMSVCSRIWAQGPEGQADLGPAATNGKEASDTIRSRVHALHKAMACGNEFNYALGFSRASQYGTNGYQKDTNSGQFPTTLMIGKAAWLIDQSRNRGPCTVTWSVIVNDWAGLTREHVAGPTDSPASVVNRVFQELYDEIKGVSAPACANVAQDTAENQVTLTLTDECIAPHGRELAYPGYCERDRSGHNRARAERVGGIGGSNHSEQYCGIRSEKFCRAQQQLRSQWRPCSASDRLSNQCRFDRAASGHLHG